MSALWKDGDQVAVKRALIDGGPDPNRLLAELGASLPAWQRRIDVMILTHPHEDHVAGLVAALERYDVALILDGGRTYQNPTYPRFLQLARDEPGGRLAAARAGDRLRLDRATTMTLLYPTDQDVAGTLPDGDINNASVVGLLRSGGFSALLTGDAEMPVEALLGERGLLTRVDVLKVGHHGSHSSTGPALLTATRPGAALISVGIGNDYGHPHQVTLDHLHALPGLRLHRTDLEGSLEVISDGRRYQVTSRAGRWSGNRSRPNDRRVASVHGHPDRRQGRAAACLLRASRWDRHACAWRQSGRRRGGAPAGGGRGSGRSAARHGRRPAPRRRQARHARPRAAARAGWRAVDGRARLPRAG